MVHTLESEPILKRLTDYILTDNCDPYKVLSGLSVLVEVVKRNSSPTLSESAPAELPAVFQVLLDRLERFSKILSEKDVKAALL